jgi:hypothetical protein
MEPPVDLATRAFSRRHDVRIGLKLIRKERRRDSERLRVVVRAVTGSLGTAQRASKMVIGKSNVGTML